MCHSSNGILGQIRVDFSLRDFLELKRALEALSNAALHSSQVLGSFTYGVLKEERESLDFLLKAPFGLSGFEVLTVAKIGTAFNPLTNSQHLKIELSLDDATAAALPRHGGSAWKQMVFDAVREQVQQKYGHVVVLVVMEQLLEALLSVRGVKITPEMEKHFERYNKLKALMLHPGTPGEGRAAAKQALKALTTVFEDTL